MRLEVEQEDGGFIVRPIIALVKEDCLLTIARNLELASADRLLDSLLELRMRSQSCSVGVAECPVLLIAVRIVGLTDCIMQGERDLRDRIVRTSDDDALGLSCSV